MTAVALLARVQLRRGWRGLVAVGLLAGFVGAVVVGALAGARRTDTAFDRLAQASSVPHAFVVPMGEAPEAFAEILALPEVESGWKWRMSVGRLVETHDWAAVQSTDDMPDDGYQPLLVRGRLPLPHAADEVVLSEDTAESTGRDVGDTLPWAGWSPEQMEEIHERAFEAPAGPRVDLRVVGVVKHPGDVEAAGVLKLVVGGEAFHRVHGVRAGGADFLVARLAGGLRSYGSFEASVKEIDAAGDERFVAEIQRDDTARAAADSATAVLVPGLLVFAAVAAAAGLVTVFQALARHHLRHAPSVEVPAALGLLRRQQAAALAAPAVLVAGVAAVTTVAGAVAVSPLFPISVARRIEPDPGVEVNVAYLGIGALALVVVVVGLAWASAWRHVRGSGRQATPRASVIAGRVASAGAPLPVVAGTRMALEPGRGRSAVPVRSTLMAAVVGVACVVASLSFAQSLGDLEGDSARWGQDYDLLVEVPARQATEATDRLAADPSVEAAAVMHGAMVAVGGSFVTGHAFETRTGEVDLAVLEGRVPAGAGEVALGPQLLGRLDVEVGDSVPVRTADQAERRFDVVGVVLSPDPLSVAYAGEALFTPDGLALAAQEAPFFATALRFVPGADEMAATERLRAIQPYGITDESPVRPPADVDNVGGVRTLPVFLAVFVGALVVAALGHALLVMVARRRRDLAVLRVLGITTRAARATVASAAMTAVVLGLALGIPLGVAAGRVTWSAVANGLHVAPGFALPLAVVGALVAGLLVVANAVTAIPARRAARLRPAQVLRAE